MKKILLAMSVALMVSACAHTTQHVSSNTDISDEEAAQRRAKVQKVDNEDYAIERSRRHDAIDDYGNMRMKEAEAINKAYENRSKQTIIVH